MFSIALLVHAQAVTRSFAVAGMVSGTYAVCGAVGSPLLGRLVDRRGQTGVLLGSSLLSAVALVGAGLLPHGASPLALIALAAVAGLATPPVSACVRALLPTLVPGPDELPGLFAFEATAIEVTFVFGPPLALGIGALWSTGVALIASALTLLVGAVLFATRPASRSWRTDRERPRGGSLRSTAVRTLVLVELASGVVFGATEVGVTAAAKHLSSAAAAAPLLGLWGAGSLLAGILATRRGGSANGVTGLLGLLAALATLHGALIAGMNDLPVMGIIIFLAGATIAPTAATIYALTDRAAPAGTATEAFSWLFAASTSGAAIGAAVAGVLVQRGGAGGAFLFAGVAGTLGALVVLLRSHHLDARPSIHSYAAEPGSAC